MDFKNFKKIKIFYPEGRWGTGGKIKEKMKRRKRKENNEKGGKDGRNLFFFQKYVLQLTGHYLFFFNFKSLSSMQ